jgi:hypothetical protein
VEIGDRRGILDRCRAVEDRHVLVARERSATKMSSRQESSCVLRCRSSSALQRAQSVGAERRLLSRSRHERCGRPRCRLRDGDDAASGPQRGTHRSLGRCRPRRSHARGRARAG